MKDMTGNVSMLHNWKQRNGIVRERPSKGTDPTWLRNRLEKLLAASLNKRNFRAIAERAGMNSLDLVETVTTKMATLGCGGLRAAIQAYADYGLVTCIQYLYSL